MRNVLYLIRRLRRIYSFMKLNDDTTEVITPAAGGILYPFMRVFVSVPRQDDLYRTIEYTAGKVFVYTADPYLADAVETDGPANDIGGAKERFGDGDGYQPG